METVYLLLGSNRGNRVLNIREAQRRIEKVIGNITRLSSVYETAAWGFTNQPAFLNQALQVQTDLSPEQLLAVIKESEKILGRRKSQLKWRPRIIDIDILFYGDQCVSLPELTVPHPHLHERRFTLLPLVEIAENFVHPVFQKTCKTLLEECTDSLEVNLLGE